MSTAVSMPASTAMNAEVDGVVPIVTPDCMDKHNVMSAALIAGITNIQPAFKERLLSAFMRKTTAKVLRN